MQYESLCLQQNKSLPGKARELYRKRFGFVSQWKGNDSRNWLVDAGLNPA
jgi:hypothetical protein